MNPETDPSPSEYGKPREMREAKPTLAPIVLAFGLAVLLGGLLIRHGVWVALLGAALTLAGIVMWARASLEETR